MQPRQDPGRASGRQVLGVTPQFQYHPQRYARAEINDNRSETMKTFLLFFAATVLLIVAAAPLFSFVAQTAQVLGRMLAGQ